MCGMLHFFIPSLGNFDKQLQGVPDFTVQLILFTNFMLSLTLVVFGTLVSWSQRVCGPIRQQSNWLATLPASCAWHTRVTCSSSLGECRSMYRRSSMSSVPLSLRCAFWSPPLDAEGATPEMDKEGGAAASRWLAGCVDGGSSSAEVEFRSSIREGRRLVP